jgi:hypothetical protein
MSMVLASRTDNLADVQHPSERVMLRLSRLGLPLALGLAVIVRVLLIWRAPGVLDGDEALVGIQAERIAAGIERFPVFFYGQHYMGSLESYLAAGLFHLIGPSVPALRLVTLAFALLLVVQVYELARRVAGQGAANAAALLAALPPPYIGVWSLKARGGYIESMVLGTALLIVTHRLIYGPNEALGLTEPLRRRTWLSFGWWLLWGLLAGVAFWVNPISVYYILTAAGTLAIHDLRSVHWRPRRHDLRLVWPRLGLILAGVGVGGAPLWIDNVQSGGATFTYLLSGSGSTESPLLRVPRVAAYFVSAILPKLTGAWSPWGAANDRWLGAAILALYAGAAVYLLVRLVAGRRGLLGYRARPRHGHGLVLAFAAVVAIIFCISGFGGVALNPFGFDAASRYALPLASVLPVAMGALLWRLWRAWAPLGAAALMVLLAATISGYATVQSDQIFQSEYWTKLPASEAPLARFLEQQGIHDVWMNHWAGYPLMFYADGQITAADYNDVVLHGGVNRLPWALQQVSRDPHAAYVLVTNEEIPRLQLLLQARGIAYHKQRTGPYVVFWGFSRPVPPSSVADAIGFVY